MARGPDLIASVHFFSSAQGGRKGPTPAGVFRCPLEFQGEKFDCGLHLQEVGPVSPGMTVTVPITLLAPDLLKPRLKEGSSFTLWETGTIAEGVVEELLHPSVGLSVPQ